jgi:adenine-specific DNA methylase
MPYPKRLIEVDLPIKRISAHARREKSIRHGHISTLHIWWARRPLAACRAVICAALWPDPADEHCPAAFRTAAEKIVLDFARKVTSDTKLANDHCSPENFKLWQRLAGGAGFQPAAQPQKTPETGWKPAPPLALRSALLDFIADFANWDNSTVREYLDTARLLTAVAHNSLSDPKFKLSPEGPDFLSTLKHQLSTAPKPLVVDPFCGGGSIPLEALRVGADAFASDLNPIPVLLNKVVLEYIPKYGQRLADAVRKWGEWIKKEAEKELAEFYPKDPDGATPIAYLWARTIQCEGPGCGAEVPLIRSLWLAKKANRFVALQIVPRPRAKRVDFQIIVKERGGWVDQDDPKTKIEDPKFDGTVKRGSATCPCCGYTTPVARVREQIKGRKGGANDARLFSVVTAHPAQDTRTYRLPNKRDFCAVDTAVSALEKRKASHKQRLSLVPDEPTPQGGGKGAGRAFSQRIYGMNTFGDMFTSRQLVSLSALSGLVREAGRRAEKEFGKELATAVTAVLGLCASKLSDLLNSLCGWQPSNDRATHLFARQAIQITWDFTESAGAIDAVGNFGVSIGNIARILDREGGKFGAGHVEKASATAHPLPDDAADALVTDPPYYDAVPYSDLSDFFYVWLRRALSETQLLPSDALSARQ